jgi:3-oxoacyl-[acyl-carrier protein] reductase
MRPNSMNLFDLTGRVALVTGGAHGIGVQYARAIALSGARVIIADIDEDGANATASELADDGLDVTGVGVDVADSNSVDRAAAAVKHIDLLVNNASIFATIPMSRAGFRDLSEEDWDRMVAVNLKGMWLLARAFVGGMQERGYGKVVNITSTTALSGSKGRLHYVAAKAGVIGFTKTLAREVGENGVTVNAVAAGSTLSEKNADEAQRAHRASAASQRAIPRTQLPADLVGAVLFFLAPASDFITGQTLAVDGGHIMH